MNQKKRHTFGTGGGDLTRGFVGSVQKKNYQHRNTSLYRCDIDFSKVLICKALQREYISLMAYAHEQNV